MKEVSYSLYKDARGVLKINAPNINAEQAPSITYFDDVGRPRSAARKT